MKHIVLTPRQEMIASLIPPNACIADIGSDHGRLAVALLQKNAVRRVIATDISQPSLQKAQKLAEICGCSDDMDLRVGDGFSVVDPVEVDLAVLSGMGTATIIHIIEQVQPNRLQLILQPMRDSGLLRRWLYEHSFQIACEMIAREKNRFYEIMLVKSGQMEQAFDFDLPYFPVLQKDDHAFAYLQKQIRILDQALLKQEAATSARSKNKLLALQDKRNRICEVIACLK